MTGDDSSSLTLWEVFTQEEGGAAHEHVGSLRAADAELALQNARDVYARRGKVQSIWVVQTTSITASTPEDVSSFFDSAESKVYRQPQFYKVTKRNTKTS